MRLMIDYLVNIVLLINVVLSKALFLSPTFHIEHCQLEHYQSTLRGKDFIRVILKAYYN